MPSRPVVESLEARTFLTAVISGFAETTYTSGFSQPTTMAFAPDGRLFVSEQAGSLRVVKNGQILSTPFVTLPVSNVGERGLLGVVFDPDFETNHWVYVYWTATSPTFHNRISRFTADPNDPDVALAGSEVDIVDFPDLGADNHNGGSMHFGPDGKLFVALGENSVPTRSQSLDNPFGKMLRFNKDGSIPTDNPFYNQTTGQNRAIWALGFRNPFTFNFQPVTGKLFINDVGQDTWEEVNQGVAGSNYGWPVTEGVTTDPRFRSPIYTYKHGPVESVSGVVIIGSSFYNPAAGLPASFPSEYTGKYFFGDGTGRYLKFIDPASPGTATLFASSIAYPVDIDVGPDGALYVLSRNGGYTATNTPGRVLRYTFNATGAPSIGTAPMSQSVAQDSSVTFTVDASGAGTLQYQWQRNGVDISGATAASYTLPAAQLTDNGAQFRVLVTNTAGTATSAAAALTVTAGHAPVPVISMPATGTFFTAGVPVQFAGSASDAEDGTLSADKLAWTVSYFTDELERPAVPETTGITSGQFTPAQTTPYLRTNVFYRIRLTATDSSGLSASTFVDVQPNTATITLDSNIPGLTLTLDGVPQQAPYTVDGVAGLIRPLGAPLRQKFNDVVYDFQGWSDGGDASHDATTPTTNVTYTATYKARVGTGTGADLSAGAVTPSAEAAIGGDAATFKVAVSNPGTDVFNSKVLFRVYLSSDTELDDTDPLVGGFSKKLNIKSSKQKLVSGKLHYPFVDSGNYYLLVDTDADNHATEADEANNVGVSATPLALQSPTDEFAATFVGAFGKTVSIPAKAGKSLTTALSITNSGNTSARGELQVLLKAAPSDQTAGTIELETYEKQVKIASGGKGKVSLKFVVPTDLPAGSYRLFATINSDGAFAESNTDDNTVMSSGVFSIS